jgi:hypothetical protein
MHHPVVSPRSQPTAGKPVPERKRELSSCAVTSSLWTIFDSDVEQRDETPAYPAEQKYDLAGACWDSANPRCRLGRPMKIKRGLGERLTEYCVRFRPEVCRGCGR